MVTEKVSKAFFWRHGIAPPMNHAGFRNFLKFHGTQRSERKRIANVFSFGRFEDLQSWVRSVLPLAGQLENLAPNLAQDGPNPEYPWPHASPQYAPALFKFDVWTQLTNTGRGRQLMQVIKVAVERFPEYCGG